MKQVKLLLALLVALALVSCEGSSGASTESAQKPVIKASDRKFVIPQSKVLTAEKAKQYAEASQAILLVSNTWTSKLSSQVPTQEKILILNSYDKARDQVCRKVGLAGMEEFIWISENALKDPANTQVLAKLGIHNFNN